MTAPLSAPGRRRLAQPLLRQPGRWPVRPPGHTGGGVVNVAVGGRTVEGYFEGLSDKGGLLLRNQSGLQELHAGEVIQADMAADR